MVTNLSGFSGLGQGKWAGWQWQPTAYGTSASHDPSPPIILELTAEAVSVVLRRMMFGLGV